MNSSIASVELVKTVEQRKSWSIWELLSPRECRIPAIILFLQTVLPTANEGCRPRTPAFSFSETRVASKSMAASQSTQ